MIAETVTHRVDYNSSSATPPQSLSRRNRYKCGKRNGSGSKIRNKEIKDKSTQI
jgi:hypothetical protein